MHFDENSFFAGNKKEANKLKVIFYTFNLIFKCELTCRYDYKAMFLFLTVNPNILLEIIRKNQSHNLSFPQEKEEVQKQVQLKI